MKISKLNETLIGELSIGDYRSKSNIIHFIESYLLDLF